MSDLFNGKAKVAMEVARAGNIPVWWVSAYLLWEIYQSQRETLRVLKQIAAASGIPVLGD